MIIGHIAGFVSLPVGVILLLNAFGFTNLTVLFGVQILLLAAIGIIATEVGDVIDSHLKGEHVLLTWIMALLLMFPAMIYFFSLAMAIPVNIMAPLPVIMGSFIFVEGLSSFFIGD